MWVVMQYCCSILLKATELSNGACNWYTKLVSCSMPCRCISVYCPADVRARAPEECLGHVLDHQRMKKGLSSELKLEIVKGAKCCFRQCP